MARAGLKTGRGCPRATPRTAGRPQEELLELRRAPSCAQLTPLALFSGVAGRVARDVSGPGHCHSRAWHGWCTARLKKKQLRREIPMANALGTRHSEDVMRILHSFPRGGRGMPDRIIVQSWARCANDYHLDPARVRAPIIVDTGTLETKRARHEDLVTIASAEMDRLYAQISGSGYALLLTDASGVILYEKVDPTLKDVFRSAGLMVGADWSEPSQGTNGMGTCLAERRPVTVHRNEHFHAHHIGLTCFGAPIRGPVDDIIAVLDASCI